uniref:Putative secreted peptide n=1 Tax=Anopheles braziliensis TaxID=58242 RepID=A0A2M3ZT11_9DIPT
MFQDILSSSFVWQPAICVTSCPLLVLLFLCFLCTSHWINIDGSMIYILPSKGFFSSLALPLSRNTWHG